MAQFSLWLVVLISVAINLIMSRKHYLTFVLHLILVFGLAFELPVFLVALNFAGILSGKAILKPWRIAVFGITLFSSTFVPTSDPLTMGLLALPLVAFYFLAGGVALLNDRRRAAKITE